MAKRRRAKKQIPLGVKIISVIYYVGAAFALLGGLLLLAGAGIIDIKLFGPLLGFAGVFLIGLAVLDFFVARGLWKGQRWAWLAAIIIAGLGILSSAISLTGGAVSANIIGLAFHSVIGGYLLLNKEAKAVFR